MGFLLIGTCEWCSEVRIPLRRYKNFHVCGMCLKELEDYDKAPLTEKTHREAQKIFNKL